MTKTQFNKKVTALREELEEIMTVIENSDLYSFGEKLTDLEGVAQEEFDDIDGESQAADHKREVWHNELTSYKALKAVSRRLLIKWVNSVKLSQLSLN